MLEWQVRLCESFCLLLLANNDWRHNNGNNGRPLIDIIAWYAKVPDEFAYTVLVAKLAWPHSEATIGIAA